MIDLRELLVSLSGASIFLVIASIFSSNDTTLTRRYDLEGDLVYPVNKQRVFESAHFIKKMRKIRKRNRALYRRINKEMNKIVKDPYKYKIEPNSYEGSKIGNRLDNIGSLFDVKFRFYGSKNIGRSERIVYIIDPPFSSPDEAQGIYSERMKQDQPLNCAIIFFDVGNHKDIYGKLSSSY